MKISEMAEKNRRLAVKETVQRVLLMIALALFISSCSILDSFTRDSDRDGISDKYDKCPKIRGLKKFNGCPDIDRDGIEDNFDHCPNLAGLPEFHGCPDTDSDGTPDNEDHCPHEAGPLQNNGCPWEDDDNDGVLDKDDQCPQVAGTLANNGCPEPSVESTGEDKLYSLFKRSPPNPSSVERISLDYFKTAQTLGDVDRKIYRALDKTGYQRVSYFTVPDGFVIVTPLEQIDKKGYPLEGENRWNNQIIYENPLDNFTFSRFFQLLYNAQKGYYRCIVIMVHKHDLGNNSKNPATEELIEKWLSTGTFYLPKEREKEKFTEDHKVTALIYQFEKMENEKHTKLLIPSTTNGKHLELSGLLKFLRNGN